MYIITEDGKLVQGASVGDSEMQVIEHFKDQFNTQSKVYITSTELNAVVTFMATHYNMSLKVAPQVTHDASALVVDLVEVPEIVEEEAI